MSMFRKKPVVIEARQMVGEADETMEVCEWIEGNGYPWLLGNALEPASLATLHGKPGDPGIYIDPATGELVIRTLEGDMRVTRGDWVIRGVQGEFYPCKPDIFADTYEATHRSSCVDGDVCGEAAHCPPADRTVGARLIGEESVSYDDFESFSEAEHGPVVIQDARFDPWVAFQTEEGDWLAVRARHKDDERYSEHDPWRPVGPEEVEELRFPVRVAEVAQVFRTAATPGEVV
jgi:hypothetical protein